MARECQNCVVRNRGGLLHYRYLDGPLCGKCRMYFNAQYTTGTQHEHQYDGWQRRPADRQRPGAFSVIAALLIMVGVPYGLAHRDQLLQQVREWSGKAVSAPPPNAVMPEATFIDLPARVRSELPHYREHSRPSGVMTYAADRDFVAPFVIVGPPGKNKFVVKLVDPATEATIISVFINPGETVETQAPLGTWRLLHASGRKWFGERHHFGRESAYFAAQQPLVFRSSNNGIMGVTLQLQAAAGGNLPLHRVVKDAF